MAHIKKTYYINEEIPIDEFSELLLDRFAEECDKTRINVVKKTDYEITFKGPLFRYTGGSFHYLNGITCGKLEVKEMEDVETNSFAVERIFCYKEALLLSLAFTILPIWMFFSPVYQFQMGETLLNHTILGFIGLFIIWGVFFAGNILWTTIRFSKFISEIKNTIIDDYIVEQNYEKNTDFT